jgi:hypothetical protein
MVTTISKVDRSSSVHTRDGSTAGYATMAKSLGGSPDKKTYLTSSLTSVTLTTHNRS